MKKKLFLHQHPDFKDICEVARERYKASIQIVEKDYWVMHAIWSLANSGYKFELKGGTSLSKGWKLISRFSEDVDIHIHPPKDLKVYSGRNHDKASHKESRSQFYNWLVDNLKIDGALSITRDLAWEDHDIRNCGIAIEYPSVFDKSSIIKPHILLEVGFAQVEPNEMLSISSWVNDIAESAQLDVVDNRAKNIKCYLPEYTFVEKLSAISKKFKQQQENKILPQNFIRHYYDVYQLLGTDRIQKFIGTKEYFEHKEKMFKDAAEIFLNNDQAFLLEDLETRKLYEQTYINKEGLYYSERPTFEEILARILEQSIRL